MRKGKMNEEPPLGSLGETREVGKRMLSLGRLPFSQNLVANCWIWIWIATSPSAIPLQNSDAQMLANHVGPTQYSTYTAANQHPAANLDDLFDLDLNPDF